MCGRQVSEGGCGMRHYTRLAGLAAALGAISQAPAAVPGNYEVFNYDILDTQPPDAVTARYLAPASRYP